MLKEQMIEFAKLLVKNVRDNAIKSSDVQLYTNNLNSPIAFRWRELQKSGNTEAFGEMLISDTVDNTIFYFLQAIDEGLLNVSFNMPSGEVVKFDEDILGELSGRYMGDWRIEYTEERYFDDLEGLDL